MLYNNKINNIVYVLYLLFFSTIANAAETEPQAAGSWLAIVPPLLTIAIALILKRVIPALFLGIWVGAWVINDFGVFGVWTGLLDTFQVFVLNALANPDHTAIVLFSMMVGGMVGIITRNGGMQGIVNHIVEWADSARHACMATAALGVAIFFDDYANTLVVGNTMRPVTDSMRVSRAKLAYIVDSTAAPVACIAVVTTWIGYEIGLIGDSLSKMEGLDTEPYLLFLNTLPYSFYPIMAIVFVFMVAATGRDFGPMLESERRAFRLGSDNHDIVLDKNQEAESLSPIDGRPQRAFNAYIPVLVMVVGVVVGLYVTGLDASAEITDPTLKDIIGNANSYYTAAVEAMLQSWQNFFYVAAEPGGSVTVDKPPLGLWIEAAFAAVLGVSGFAVAERRAPVFRVDRFGGFVVRMGGLRRACHVLARFVAGVNIVCILQLLPSAEKSSVALALAVGPSLAAHVGAFVPVATEPAEVFDRTVGELGLAALRVEVFVAVNELAARFSRALHSNPKSTRMSEV